MKISLRKKKRFFFFFPNKHFPEHNLMKMTHFTLSIIYRAMVSAGPIGSVY